MTTKVTILNHGPDQVMVRTFSKDSEPGDDSKAYSDMEVIHPGRHKEFYVHKNQALDIDEFDGKFLGGVVPDRYKP